MKPMEPMKPMKPMEPMHAEPAWWPADLGTPATSGSQNDVRYAFFPAKQRLVVQQDGTLSVYESGEHNISGVSQQQGGANSLAFTSQFGTLDLTKLKKVSGT